jgi:hypothetical protein
MKKAIQKHAWLLLVVACGNPASAPDARAIDAVPSTTCDPSGVFDPPVPVPGLSSAGFRRYARFSPDELTAVFTDEAGSGMLDIYQAERPSIADSFGTPVKLGVSSDTGQDFAPTLSPDQLTIVFASDRVFGGIYQLYEATRTSPTATFGAPSLASGVQPPDPRNQFDDLPFLTGDGQELWFESGRPGTSTIWRAAVNGSAFANPMPVPELDNWNSPVLSADRLTVYVSNFPQDPPVTQVWVAHRSATTEAFPAPAVVRELGSTAADPTWLSPDNCRLYLQDGGGEIYVAVRHPPT